MVSLFWDGTFLRYIAELHNVLDNRTVPIEPWRPAHIYCLLSIVDPLGSDAGRGVGEFNDIEPGAASVVPSRRVDLASVLTRVTGTCLRHLQRSVAVQIDPVARLVVDQAALVVPGNAVVNTRIA